MTREWCEAIAKNGFVSLPSLFSTDEVHHLIESIDQLMPRRSRAGIRHALRLPPVATLAQEPRMIESVREVLGPHAVPFRATLFDKSIQSNWLVVWHQDTALPLQRRMDLPGWGPWSVKDGIDYAHAPAVVLEQVLALRLSLDDSTTENGPLRVLPGTHTLGVLSDDAVHDLTTKAKFVDCVVPKGSLLAMRPLLIHASSKSHNCLPRRVLHIEYAASAEIATPLKLAVA